MSLATLSCSCFLFKFLYLFNIINIQNTDIHWKNETAITAAPNEALEGESLFPKAKYRLFKSLEINTIFINNYLQQLIKEKNPFVPNISLNILTKGFNIPLIFEIEVESFFAML